MNGLIPEEVPARKNKIETTSPLPRIKQRKTETSRQYIARVKQMLGDFDFKVEDHEALAWLKGGFLRHVKAFIEEETYLRSYPMNEFCIAIISLSESCLGDELPEEEIEPVKGSEPAKSNSPREADPIPVVEMPTLESYETSTLALETIALPMENEATPKALMEEETPSSASGSEMELRAQLALHQARRQKRRQRSRRNMQKMPAADMCVEVSTPSHGVETTRTVDTAVELTPASQTDLPLVKAVIPSPCVAEASTSTTESAEDQNPKQHAKPLQTEEKGVQASLERDTAILTLKEALKQEKLTVDFLVKYRMERLESAKEEKEALKALQQEVSSLKAQLGEALTKIDQLVKDQETLRVTQTRQLLQNPPAQKNRKQSQQRKTPTYQPKYPNKKKTAPPTQAPTQKWIPKRELYPCLPGSNVPSYDRQWAWVVKTPPTEPPPRKVNLIEKASTSASIFQARPQTPNPPRRSRNRKSWQYRPRGTPKYKAILPPADALYKPRDLGKRPMLELTFPDSQILPRRTAGVVITEME